MSNGCNKCGRCCANILMLSNKEIDNIRDYIEQHDISVINRNTIFMKEDINVCPFLSNNNMCNIYEVRPSICRSYNCNPKISRTMNYDGVQAINMLFTFGGEDQFSIKSPDLTFINKRIKQLQEKIKKGGKNK